MEFEDPVYGTKTVSEPVLQELIDSKPVQRLKHIGQAGPQQFLDRQRITRFQHSLGVMFLLQDHGAPLEEQIAGLLHDVPHTAFSHVADFVFQTDDHEYHERFMDQIVYDSEIPQILSGHGLDIEYILDESNFPLLEQDLPDLCADRIDYFLRDVAVYSDKNVSPFRDAITTNEDLFVLTDKDLAEQYALTYIWADEAFWANPREVAIFELFGRIIRHAIETGLLQKEDMFKTDEEVYHVLDTADDKKLQEKMDVLRNGISVRLDEENPDFYTATKVRYVDPVVVTEDTRFRLSERSETVRKRIEEHKNYVGSGYPIKILG